MCLYFLFRLFLFVRINANAFAPGRYYLFLADSSKSKFQEEIDTFSDYYYWDIDIADIKQV